MSEYRTKTGEPAAGYLVFTLEWHHDSRWRTQAEAEERFRQLDLTSAASLTLDDEGGVQTWVVRQRRWAPVALWKHLWQAQRWAEVVRTERRLREDEVEVVGRGSRRERVLRT